MTPPGFEHAVEGGQRGRLRSGVERRSKLAFTVSASSGVPSEKVTPSRSVTVQRWPSSSGAHDSASCGRSVKSGSSQIRYSWVSWKMAIDAPSKPVTGSTSVLGVSAPTFKHAAALADRCGVRPPARCRRRRRRPWCAGAVRRSCRPSRRPRARAEISGQREAEHARLAEHVAAAHAGRCGRGSASSSAHWQLEFVVGHRSGTSFGRGWADAAAHRQLWNALHTHELSSNLIRNSRPMQLKEAQLIDIGSTGDDRTSRRDGRRGARWPSELDLTPPDRRPSRRWVQSPERPATSAAGVGCGASRRSCCVHDLGDSANGWDAVAHRRRSAARGALDLAGHGRSSSADRRSHAPARQAPALHRRGPVAGSDRTRWSSRPARRGGRAPRRRASDRRRSGRCSWSTAARSPAGSVRLVDRRGLRRRRRRSSRRLAAQAPRREPAVHPPPRRRDDASSNDDGELRVAISTRLPMPRRSADSWRRSSISAS